MKDVMVAVLFGLVLTGCAGGLITSMGFSRCDGYEEFKESYGAHQRAKTKQQDILFAYRRVPLNAVTTEKNGVSTTVLVNPLEEEREEISREVAIHGEKVDAFIKKCTLFTR